MLNSIPSESNIFKTLLTLHRSWTWNWVWFEVVIGNRAVVYVELDPTVSG
jgi:hypothetical protein